MRNLKLYNLNTTFDFGMYTGKTIADIMDEMPCYLGWCSIQVDWFLIDLDELKEAFPDKEWSETKGYLEVKEALDYKWEKYCSDIKEHVEASCYADDSYESDSYGEYAGTYAQDVEGLSDDFINDVLGGEPDAYWNID
ncbi:hypothetical protein N8Z75_02065 [Crocinitomicaceae bacterium]|jgi:hypothetical protein|nr:hypothetical protein [Crocinitomicaceae bacterium]